MVPDPCSSRWRVEGCNACATLLSAESKSPEADPATRHRDSPHVGGR